MLQAITSRIEFGIFFTIGLYVLSKEIIHRTKWNFLNPLFLSILIGVPLMVLLGIEVSDYQVGGAWVNFLLGPATVCLVVPFYKQSYLFKRNWKPILVGILAGSLAGLAVTVILFSAFRMPEALKHAFLVKNATGPIALEISELVGRPTELVMLLVLTSGVFGFMFGNVILRIIKVDNKVARGIAFGNASHIVGTAKAITNSEEEGAMSSISILITGLVYLVLVPILMQIW